MNDYTQLKTETNRNDGRHEGYEIIEFSFIHVFATQKINSHWFC